MSFSPTKQQLEELGFESNFFGDKWRRDTIRIYTGEDYCNFFKNSKQFFPKDLQELQEYLKPWNNYGSIDRLVGNRQLLK